MELSLSPIMTPLKPSLHLFSEWRIRVIEDAQFEASETHVKMLEDEGRKAVWVVSTWLGCESRGLPGAACRLLERYLSYVMLEPRAGVDETSFRESLQAELPLLMASCLTLVSKMNSTRIHVSARMIYFIFQCKKIPFTIKEIIANEFKVFKTLGFRVPLWTNVELGEMLLLDSGLPSRILSDFAKVMTITEYNFHDINKKVLQQYSLMNGLQASKVLALHLTAGAVAATAQFMVFSGPETLPRLATITLVTEAYIKCIRDVIYAEIYPEFQK